MRVLIVDPWEDFTGPAQFCHDFFHRPTPTGFSILILKSSPGLRDGSLQHETCDVRIISHTGMIPTARDWRQWLRYPVYLFISTFAILRSARSFRPDILWSNTELNPLVGALARVMRIPSVARIHAQTLGRHGWLGRTYACCLGHLFDSLSCNSLSTARYIANLGVPESKLHVTYNAVDTRRFVPGTPSAEGRSALGATLSDFLAICVAHHAPIKGVHVLLDAFEDFGRLHHDAHLSIVGSIITPLDKEYSDSLFARVSGSEILKRCVTFCSPSNQIHRVLQQADVVVQPSLSEAAGRIATEASSSGIPVIASNTGGLMEAVVDGKTGWLVPPGDAKSLAQALSEAYADPAQRRQRGAVGIEYSAQYHSDNITKAFYALCSSLVLERNPDYNSHG